MTLKKKNNILPTQLNNRLSVQVSLTGLSFFITDFFSGEKVFFTEKTLEQNASPEELLIEIESTISQSEALKGAFKEVVIIYATNLYTVTPTSLFDETKASDYLKFNSKILANDFVAYDSVENYDITIIYVPFVNINNFFFERYGSFKYYHAITILLRSFLDFEKHSEEKKVYLHVTNDVFDFIVVQQSELLLCNTYSFKTPEDFIYYVLFSLEQLKLNPDTIEFILCGNINDKDPNYRILYKYVRNIEFFKPSDAEIDFQDSVEPHDQFLLKNSL